MKKIFSFILTLLITFLPVFNINNLSFADSEPNLTAEYAVLMDYETGQVLYSKNGYNKLYPASTTKAWTAYVVLKHVSDLNQVVEIKDLPIVDGSSMYLKEGEAFTVKELLDALLIHSSNDVAMVLAKYVGGSVENFVNMMNNEAKAIGAKNTHFNNPHGLPDENHYTTAYDMALMARKAMDNDIFRDIVKTKSVKYPATEAYPYERYFENTNQFLTSRSKMDYKGQQIDIKYDVVDGIKTGYTDAAGKCLLSTGIKNNIRVISAVFKSTVNDLYLDSRTLLDYGFDNFYVETIVDKNEFIKDKKVFFFLIAFFLYIDGVGTIIDNCINIGTDLNLSTVGQVICLLATQVVAFGGSLVFAKLSKKYDTVQLILVCIAGYFIVCLYALTLKNLIGFSFLAFGVGCFQGSIQSLSRSYFSKIIPPDNSGEYFGLYDIFSKGASFLGSAVIAGVKLAGGTINIAVASQAIFFFLGFIFLKIADGKERRIVESK